MKLYFTSKESDLQNIPLICPNCSRVMFNNKHIYIKIKKKTAKIWNCKKKNGLAENQTFSR